MKADRASLEARFQIVQANMRFEGVIGNKPGCQYINLPHFVKEVADFKADSDVIICHITDQRLELRLKDIF